MRSIAEVKYEIRKESDVAEDMIYAFSDQGEIAILSRKADNFFWNCLFAVNWSWTKMYDTIEQSIEGILNETRYRERKCSPIYEFETQQEFIEWAYKSTINYQLSTINN